MLSRHKSFFCLRRILSALSLGLLLLAGPAAAMDLDTYDADSLAYQSTEIVEADLGGPGKADGYPATMATVTAVYKGHFQLGQQVALVALGFFQKANPDARLGYWADTKPLVPGNHVFLFLVRATKQFLYDIPATAEVYWPVFGGVKLVQNGQVLGFEQYNNPGPYVSDLPGPKELTVGDFKVALSQNLTTARRYAAVLGAESGMKSVPALMQVLRERAGYHRTLKFERDAIAEGACTQIAALRSPVLLEQAAQVVSGGQELRILEQGFATPPGRQYLLRRIADKRLTLEHRRQLAEVLQTAGFNWYLSVPAEAKFITQTARLAQDNAGAEPLCLDLLDAVLDDAGGISQLRQQKFAMPQLELDLRSALSVLNALYRKTPSEAVRYQIEVIEADADATAYADLHSSCGPIISLVSAVHLGPGDAKAALGVGCSVTSPFGPETEATPEIMLMRLPTRETKTLPLPAGWGADELQQGSEGGGSHETFPLPSELAHGVYRVFLQFRQDGKIVSVGHYWQGSL